MVRVLTSRLLPLCIIVASFGCSGELLTTTAIDDISGLDVGVPDDDASGSVSGEPVSCDDDTGCVGAFTELGACTLSVCQEGLCVEVPAPVGAPCDDGNLCTDGTVCSEVGICGDGAEVICDDGNVCTNETCDPASGCVYESNLDPCDDGDQCTTGDTCKDGQCFGAVNPQCECSEPSDCAEFEDGDLCNGVYACTDGFCVIDEATIVVCEGEPTACSEQTCNAESGQCEDVNINEGGACPDGMCVDGSCVAPGCGDGMCSDAEDAESCPTDCYVAECGDGECEGAYGEDDITCPDDCVEVLCGDGICDADNGEDAENCEVDCYAASCGDGACESAFGEDAESCPVDCYEAECGDGICELAYGEDAESCAADCYEAECGDGICEGDFGEDVESCAADCYEAECGDGICEGEFGEDAESCVVDCGPILGNIVEELTLAGNFELLLSLLETAGLTEAIATQELTVFAPTDEVLAQLTDEELNALSNDPDLLVSILTYHAAAGALSAEALVAAGEVETLNGASITFEGGADEGDPVLVNGEDLIAIADLPATNGVIHVLSGILFPPGLSQCPEGEFEGCEGLCVPVTALGDGQCDDILNCEEAGFDGGDCIDPPECDDDEVVGCDNTCVQASWVGDNFCDSALSCEDFEWDGGDCCPDGQERACDSDDCVDSALKGDGTCDEAFNCEANSFDGGDCEVVCPEGQIPDCFFQCTTATWVGDGGCDPSLNCEAFNFDEGDCEIQNLPGLYDTLKAADNFTIIVQAIEAVGPEFVNELNEGGPYGVFAPSDEAMGQIPAETLQALLGDQEALLDLLLYHVTSPPQLAEALLTVEAVPTENGLPISVEVVDGGIILNGSASVEQADILASNGVIHQIDAVLQAPELICGDGLCLPGEELGCPDDCPYDPASCCEYTGNTTCTYQPCIDAVNAIDDFCSAQMFDSLCTQCARGESYTFAGNFYDCSATDAACQCDTLGPEPCSEGQANACDGTCVPADLLGNGMCDLALDCPETNYDNGDCQTSTVCEDTNNGATDSWGDGCEYYDMVPTACGTDYDTETFIANEMCCACGGGTTGGGPGPDVCPEGEIKGCEGQCVSASLLENGVCDAELNCPENNNDNGACEPPTGCAEGEFACQDGECIIDGWVCDGYQDCFGGEDEADCEGCPQGQIPDCDGGCTFENWLGDAYCDESFNCEAQNLDDGDCDTCGNGFCGPQEIPSTCPEDCGESQCADDEVDACDGSGCVPASKLGNGTCDEELNCSAYTNDNGDCCPAGTLRDCEDGCTFESWYGDFICDAEFNCAALEFDGGVCAFCGDGTCDDDELPSTCPDDCDDNNGGGPGPDVCPEGEIKGCEGQCVSASLLENGVCDAELNCPENNNDNGACEPPTGCGEGEFACQDGECIIDGWVCDGYQDCFGGEDEADCEGCPQGQIPDCDGGCTFENWLGDAYCDESFNCEAQNLDDGDCDTCGNGFCGPQEIPSTCPEDCGESQCADDEVDACDGSGCVPASKLGNGTCDEELNCSAYTNDNEDCCPAGSLRDCEDGCTSESWYGDFFCDAEFNCAAFEFDGGVCAFCGDGTCDDDELPSTCPDDCDDNNGGGPGPDVCPEGEIKGCEGQCVSASLLENDVCDAELNCPENNNDNGACEPPTGCAEGEFACQDGECIIDGWVCDGITDCFGGEDEADCEGCPQGQIPDCNGGCNNESWVGDDLCDPGFDCESFELDGGDCDECGNGFCGPKEDQESCPEDCTGDGDGDGDGSDDGAEPDEVIVDFKVNMNCADVEFTTVYVTGPWNNWCGNCNPLSDDNGDGLWTGSYTFSADIDLEYKYVVDNFAGQEDLIDDMQAGAGCAPSTDYSTYANRVEALGGLGGTSIGVSDTYGSCTECGSEPTGVTFSVDMTCAQVPFQAVYVSGPFVDWCENCRPLSDEDGDGIWTGTYSFPAGTSVEYKYQVDEWAFQEDLVDDMQAGADCAPITNFETFANRLVTVPDGPAIEVKDVYGTCGECADGPGPVQCTDGEIADCFGGCSPGNELGDTTCHDQFNCEELNYDDEDCPVPCAEGEVKGCDGACADSAMMGNLRCDDIFNCEAFGFDGGECGENGKCADGDLATCNGACGPASIVGDGDCDAEYDCLQSNFDGEDCSGPAQGDCPDGEIVNCSGGCTPEWWFGDDICDSILACEELQYDGGDCCPPGYLMSCDGESCVEAFLLGNEDGCTEAFACSFYNFDDGSCSVTCDDDELLSCDGSTCVPIEWLDDTICDVDLNCEANGWDNGACDTCGDGYCGPTESSANCALDCGVCGDGVCGDSELPSTCPADCAGDDGPDPDACPEGQLKDCNDDCSPQSWLDDAICQEAFNCASFNDDSGACSDEGPCDADEVLSCGGFICLPSDWLDDGMCDSSLDCEETNYDGGDCAQSGPGGQCTDLDDGVTDSFGYSCSSYVGVTSLCGFYDTADFVAAQLCCACGGGSDDPDDVPPVCEDTTNGALDPYGDGCEWYLVKPDDCGIYDDSDFIANDMCCACGGGSIGDDSPAMPKLVINEFDADQDGADTMEFVELYNPTDQPVSIAGWVFKSINGSNSATIWEDVLETSGATEIGPGGYLVIGQKAVLEQMPSDVAFVEVTGTLLQNGNEAASLYMLDPTGEVLQLVDTVAWGAPLAGHVEQEPAPKGTDTTSVGRCPNGADTDDNEADFVLMAPTPGEVNICP